MGAKREPPRRWSRKLAAAACALALATLALRLAASRPGAAQHWLASVNVEERAGVPRRCGSDGRATYAWMNPTQFNRTFTRARGATQPTEAAGTAAPSAAPGLERGWVGNQEGYGV